LVTSQASVAAAGIIAIFAFLFERRADMTAMNAEN
jgi:hypothetical protein